MFVRGSWGYNTGTAERIPHPVVVAAADDLAVMLEQLANLGAVHAEHAVRHPDGCVCDECEDFLRVREILLRRMAVTEV